MLEWSCGLWLWCERRNRPEHFAGDRGFVSRGRRVDIYLMGVRVLFGIRGQKNGKLRDTHRRCRLEKAQYNCTHCLSYSPYTPQAPMSGSS
jgi:hypothetical protein